MAAYTVICSDTRTDVYSEGHVCSSHPAGLFPSLCMAEDDTIEYFCYPCNANIRNTLTDGNPILIQADDCLVSKNGDKETSIPLDDILSSSVNSVCDIVDKLQQQAGFFAMSEEQRKTTAKYLSHCMQELTVIPKSLSVPVNAWFNYAQMDDSAYNEDQVLDHVVIPWQNLQDRIVDDIAARIKSNVKDIVHEQVFVRSGIINEAIRRAHL